jgi:hypothetical protein
MHENLDTDFFNEYNIFSCYLYDGSKIHRFLIRLDFHRTRDATECVQNTHWISRDR